MAIDLSVLQEQVSTWSRKNFGPYFGSGYRPLLGLMEEVGELSHAHLKQEQGIRTSEEHQKAKIDAVGDIVIYLADYCQSQGIGLEAAVRDTWYKVGSRDWKRYPKNGMTE